MGGSAASRATPSGPGKNWVFFLVWRRPCARPGGGLPGEGQTSPQDHSQVSGRQGPRTQPSRGRVQGVGGEWGGRMRRVRRGRGARRVQGAPLTAFPASADAEMTLGPKFLSD